MKINFFANKLLKNILIFKNFQSKLSRFWSKTADFIVYVIIV